MSNCCQELASLTYSIPTIFEDMEGIPWVVSAIDETHIPIKAPIENPNGYINRKLFPSVQFENQICLFQLKI